MADYIYLIRRQARPLRKVNQMVVGSGIQPCEPVPERIGRCQDQDRESCSGCPRWHRQPRGRVAKGLDGRIVPLLSRAPGEIC